MNGKFVTYYRVSRTSQGIEGLGMDAQRKAVAGYLNGGSWEVVGEFEEVESGKRSDRPQLAKAIAAAKASSAKLLIAKLDRLSRNVHFLSGLTEQGVEFVAADMPEANTFTVHIMAAVAQQEREAISLRTTVALDSIKERIKRDGKYVAKSGKTITGLGGTNRFDDRARSLAADAVKQKADKAASRVLPLIASLRTGGSTLQQTADHLNKAELKTPRGGRWTPTAVQRVEKRCKRFNGPENGC